MNGHERAYNRLLRLYPGEFRAHYGAEMARLFADQVRDAEASRRPFAFAALWARSVVDLLATASKEHLEKEHPVPQPVDVTSAALVPEPRRIPNGVLRVLLGLLPMWILVIRVVAVPGSMDPVLENPSALGGLPAGIVLLGAALVVMAIGVVVLRRPSSTRSTLLAFVCLTLPSTVVIVLAPAIILVVQND